MRLRRVGAPLKLFPRNFTVSGKLDLDHVINARQNRILLRSSLSKKSEIVYSFFMLLLSVFRTFNESSPCFYTSQVSNDAFLTK